MGGPKHQAAINRVVDFEISQEPGIGMNVAPRGKLKAGIGMKGRREKKEIYWVDRVK